LRPIPKSNAIVLARSPEMAIVELLDSALGLATHALFAANPELESSEFLLEMPQPSVQACLADALLMQIVALEAAVRSYRIYVVERGDQRPPDEPMSGF
jgi:hypothetical protein